MQISREEIGRAVALVEDGRSVQYAVCFIRKAEITVRRAVQRYRETQTVYLGNVRGGPAQRVRRRKVLFGLSARRPTRLPRLTIQHKQRRLEFARLYENWEDRHWKAVVFSHES